MAPDADTPVRDLTMNITARLGGLSAVLEDDAEWQSSSRSRSNASPGASSTSHTALPFDINRYVETEHMKQNHEKPLDSHMNSCKCTLQPCCVKCLSSARWQSMAALTT